MYFRLIGLWALALLILLPTGAKGDRELVLMDHRNLLPQLQKELGKDWSVRVIPEGYLLTYARPVTFYPTVSPSSKMDIYQRVARGRRDSLRIKIVVGPALPSHIVLIYGQRVYGVSGDDPPPPEVGIQREYHYFLCMYHAWITEQKDTLYFFTNGSPDEQVYPEAASDVYYRALDAINCPGRFVVE